MSNTIDNFGREDKKTAQQATERRSSYREYAVHLSTFALIISAIFATYYFQDSFEEIRNFILSSIYGTMFFYVSTSILVFKLLFIGYLWFHYKRYRAVDSVSDEELPTCTIIVPAYNEGKFVYETLMSISESNYPKEKIQLLAIDDGSKDDTWTWMQKAANELGDFIKVYQQPKNMGKRHALYRAFKQGSGEVFVTIDSDSIINANTLRNLVSPFVVDQKCGAVAGNVKVWNKDEAVIPKMLNASFAFSFGFIRSAQSRLNTVLCTPGALSAYRKEAVLECVEEWINQSFCGVKTDIGEDRAMTNMILKQGYNTKFQSNAVVFTNIPETYSTLHKMFTRWERSNVRENIMMSKFAFTKFRDTNRIHSRILLMNQWTKILFVYPSLIATFLIAVSYPLLVFSSMVVSVFLFSLIPVTYYCFKYNLRSSLWIFSYNLFYALSLFWITPLAIVTANKRGWLTRELTV